MSLIKSLLYVRYCVLIVFISGITNFVLDEFFSVENDYGMIQSSPLLSDSKFIHLLSSVLLIFWVGNLFSQHILVKLKSKKIVSRNIGIVLVVIFVFLVLSGFFLFYLTNENYLDLLAILHLIGGVVFGILFGIHLRVKSYDRAIKR